jgi:hypothetical protein
MARTIILIAALSFAAFIASCSPAATTSTSSGAASTATSASASPASDSAGAIAAVTALYQPYLKHQNNAPAWYQALPMTPELAALVQRDQANTQAGDEGAVEADPIIAAQDFELTDLSVTADGAFANGRGVVTAHFKNIGEETDVHYDVVERASDHAWLIDNVRSKDSDLRALLAPPAHH